MKVNPSFELLKSLPSLQFSTVFPLRTPSPIMVWIWTEWSFTGSIIDNMVPWHQSWESFPHGVLCFPSLKPWSVLQLGDDVTDIPQDPLLLAVAMKIRKKNGHPKKNKQFTGTISTFVSYYFDCFLIIQFHNQKNHPKKQISPWFFSNLCYVESSPSGSHLVTSPDCPGDAAGLEGSNQPMHPPPGDRPSMDWWVLSAEVLVVYSLYRKSETKKQQHFAKDLILCSASLCLFVGKSLSLN